MKIKRIVALSALVGSITIAGCGNGQGVEAITSEIATSTTHISESTVVPSSKVELTTSVSKTEHDTKSADPFERFPLVTYEDIQAGTYNGQMVCVDAIVSNMDIRGSSCSFNLWYKNGETYFLDSSSNAFYNIENGDPREIFLNTRDGDIVRYITRIYDDGSFGTTSLFNAKVVGQADINTVMQIYQQNCSPINYEDVSRNPDNFKNISYMVTGTIFQIIDEGSYSAEYLISTPNGYIYASWYINEQFRGARFLENDSVVLYGCFTGLQTYDTLINKNTVPSISIVSMELQ